MSASERVRALGAPFDLRDTHTWIECDDGVTRELRSMVALYDALPLIADVVEAAETLAAWWPNEVHGEISGEQFQPLRDALTALRERLEGQ